MNARAGVLSLILIGCGEVAVTPRDAAIDAAEQPADATPDAACTPDCAGVCGGTAAVDRCGVCDTNPKNDCLWPDNATATCIRAGQPSSCPAPEPLGQDGNYVINAPTYQVNNETVLDPITRLEWERNPGYGDVDWTVANNGCDSLSLGGQSDWRLPTRLELLSLVDAGRILAPFEPTAFSGIPQNSFFWTSTQSSTNANERFIVNTNYATWAFTTTISNLPVMRRCVRGPAITGALTVVDDHVEDARTNLMWQSGNLSPAVNWAGALAYCEALSLDGFTDWRLPSNKELFSIVDDTRTSPAIGTVFTSRPAGLFWTSTPVVGQTSSVGAYVVDFTGGASGGQIEVGFAANAQVRCVRGP